MTYRRFTQSNVLWDNMFGMNLICLNLNWYAMVFFFNIYQYKVAFKLNFLKHLFLTKRMRGNWRGIALGLGMDPLSIPPTLRGLMNPSLLGHKNIVFSYPNPQTINQAPLKFFQTFIIPEFQIQNSG